jgi:hypothetical protein
LELIYDPHKGEEKVKEIKKYTSIKVNFNWIDDEVAEIQCPYCNKPVIIDIYEDFDSACVCGKKFLLHQSSWVSEVIP